MRKLCWFSSAFAVSIFATVYLLPEALYIPLGIFCGLLCFLCVPFRAKTRKRILLSGLGLLCGFLWCGCYGMIFRTPSHMLADQGLNTYTLTVREFPKETKYGASLIATLELKNAPDPSVYLYAGEDALSLIPGDTFSAALNLSRSDFRHGESYDYFQSRGIYLIGSIQGDFTLLERPDHISPLYWPQWAAKTIRDTISRLFPSRFSGFFTALLTGDKSFLPDGLYASLRRAGIAHIVAVSGLHISFLSGLFTALFKRRDRLTVFLHILILFFFAVMTGGTYSAFRAAFMASTLLLAPLLGRENDRLTTLSAALLILLLACPYAAASVNLQLSFTSLLGITLITDELNARFCAAIPAWVPSLGNPLHKLSIFIAGSLAISLGAMLFSLPILALYYRSVSIIAILSNTLILGIVSISFFLGLVAALIGLIHPGLGGFLGQCASLPAGLMLSIADKLSRIPFAAITLFSGYLMVWFLTAYMIFLLWIFSRGRVRFYIPGATLGLTLCIALLIQAYPVLSSRLTVTVLDVGQGSSTLLYSKGHTVLIDCGGNKDNAGDIAADRIQALGSSQLDTLILTHYDSDHINGVSELMARLQVNEVILPDVDLNSEARSEILLLCKQNNCNVKLLYEDDITLPFGEANLNVYIPMGNSTTNLAGLSVLCTAGDFDLLITGDMDIATEQRLLKYKALPDIELLIVGHHGSKNATSAELLLATRPEQAVISVGYNSYDHPSEQVLERLTAIGCEIYRTDWMGSITFTVCE